MKTLTEPLETAALVERCQRGERTALGELYRRYRPDVARNLLRILGPSMGRGTVGGAQELEDVLQEVFIELFRSIQRFRGDAKLTTWIYRVCVNVALQRLRKRRRLAEVTLPPSEVLGELLSPQGGPPDRELDTRRRLAVVYRLLDQLAPKKRVAFILSELEGLDPKEIATLVGAPVITVRTRLHYARKEFFALAVREPGLEGQRHLDEAGAEVRVGHAAEEGPLAGAVVGAKAPKGERS
jgi:RNA polymerase sigma-70 factor (ECF subfamily)